MNLPKAHRAFISVQDASFRLGESAVFEHTSWTFHTHEHWAIIGANGSGKSLLADGLRGLLPLAQGSLRYHLSLKPLGGLLQFDAGRADQPHLGLG